MTTTQQTLPTAAVVASVEAVHDRSVTALGQLRSRVPVALVALDLVAVTLPAVLVPWLLHAWSPVLQAGVPLMWLVLLKACGGYGSRETAGRPSTRGVWQAATGLALVLLVVAAAAPGWFGGVGATARAVVALTLIVPVNTLGLRRAAAIGVCVDEPRAASTAARFAKEVADRVGAAILLVVLSPVLLCLMAMIWIDSEGSAIFRQSRVGQGGRTFTMLKLRTMHAGAEEDVERLAWANDCDPSSLLFKIRLDPRITGIGAALRKYSLDELPQLVNVLRGEMSLIGPRPALPSEVRAYTPEQLRRLDVRPGMTGLWQVSGRSDLSWDDSVRLDLTYVDDWSWWMDLSIAARTFGAVLGHRGAY